MTTTKQIEEILEDYRQCLNQQMGLILQGRHRLDIKTADKALIDEPKQAILNLITEEVRKARIEELKRLKAIDCFNEPYTSDPRPAKLVSIRLSELQREEKA